MSRPTSARCDQARRFSSRRGQAVSRCSRSASWTSRARAGEVQSLPSNRLTPVQPLGDRVDVHVQRLGGAGGEAPASKYASSVATSSVPRRASYSSTGAMVASTKPRTSRPSPTSSPKKPSSGAGGPALAARARRARPRSGRLRVRGRHGVRAGRRARAARGHRARRPRAELPAHRCGRGRRRRRAAQHDAAVVRCGQPAAGRREGGWPTARARDRRWRVASSPTTTRRAGGPGRRRAGGRGRAAPSGRGGAGRSARRAARRGPGSRPRRRCAGSAAAAR